MIEPTDNSMPPVMITKAFADREDSLQANLVGRVRDIAGKQETRVEIGDKCPDGDNQDEKAEIFLEHLCSVFN